MLHVAPRRITVMYRSSDVGVASKVLNAIRSRTVATWTSSAAGRTASAGARSSYALGSNESAYELRGSARSRVNHVSLASRKLGGASFIVASEAALSPDIAARSRVLS